MNMKNALIIGMVSTYAMATYAAQGTLRPAERTFELKRIEPRRIIYLEHTGPYWTLRSVFLQISEIMAAHHETGPMFARYLADPTAVPATTLRTQVGFVAKGDWEPQPPLFSAQAEGEEVAATVVEGSYGTTMRYHSEIRNWLSEQGLEAMGPVIELYPTAPSAASAKPLRTEIQVPFRRIKATAVTTTESWVAEVSPRLPEKVDVPNDPSPVQPAPEPLSLIKDLFSTARFDRIAEQVVPIDRPMAVPMQVWLGQIVFRISGLAKGLEHTYPGEAADVVALADACAQRLREASANWKVNPLDQAVVRVDTRSDPQAAQKRAIMRDLDQLLGQVAMKTIDPKAAGDRLVAILQLVQETTNPATLEK